MNQPVKVFWDSENEWFEGIIDQVDEEKGYHVSYHDGDQEWINHSDIRDPLLVQFLDESFNIEHIDAPQLERELGQTADEVIIVDDPKNSSSPQYLNIPQIQSKLEEEEDDNEDHSETKLSSPNDEDIHLLASQLEDRALSSPHTQASIQSNAPSVSYLEYHDIVLAKGKVHYVAHLPKPIQEDRDGRLFFKVLFAGGENAKSALFQCKTPVFESNMTIDTSDRVEWTSNAFKFEIDKIMVGEDVPAQGDIIIAIYRQRSFGGNEFVGQAVVNVMRLCQEGSKGRAVIAGHSVQSRSVKTALPLYDRGGREILRNARIGIELSLSWKVESSQVSEGHLFDSLIRLSSARTSLSKGSSRQQSRIHNEKIPAARSGNSKGGLRVQRNSVVSKPSGMRMNKAQKEFQWKVERENKSMQSRLAKHATKSQDPRRLNVYGGGKNAPVADLKSLAELSCKEKFETKIENTEEEEYRRILSIHNQLKADIANATEDNKTMSARLSALQTQTKKWEISSERNSKVATAEPARITAVDTEQVVNFLGLLEQGTKEPQDVELREMLTEYKYLQDTRRSLRKRVEAARSILMRHSSSAETNRRTLEKFKVLAVGNESTEDIQHSNTVSYKLEEAKLELLRLQGIHSLKLHYSHFQDAIEELIRIQSFLETRVEEEKASFDSIAYERDLLRERLVALKESGINEDWREKNVNARNNIILQSIERALAPSQSSVNLL